MLQILSFTVTWKVCVFYWIYNTCSVLILIIALFITDKSIPTIDLGIPNTETGHCEKTFAIINITATEANRNPNLKWLFIADDDTILR